jgi:uncharacterized protein YecE (DUF72 family)
VRMHRIGTAGWSLPKGSVGEGSRLERYSRVLCCTEINSSFYRVHRASTWARWVAETPEDFRFSIKAAKTITHEAKLRGAEPLLRAFLEQIQPMEGKAGPLLFQLPPWQKSFWASSEHCTWERRCWSRVTRAGLLRRQRNF